MDAREHINTLCITAEKISPGTAVVLHAVAGAFLARDVDGLKRLREQVLELGAPVPGSVSYQSLVALGSMIIDFLLANKEVTDDVSAILHQRAVCLAVSDIERLKVIAGIAKILAQEAVVRYAAAHESIVLRQGGSLEH